jgi:hypothetical protein
MTPEDLQSYRVDLFADRETIEEALAYVYSMRDPAATTAAHVLLNTVIKVLTPATEPVL